MSEIDLFEQSLYSDESSELHTGPLSELVYSKKALNSQNKFNEKSLQEIKQQRNSPIPIKQREKTILRQSREFGAKRNNKVKSSKGVQIKVFNRSSDLDKSIVSELFQILSNKSLIKEQESEYFEDLNIFDQEWEFPFNKNHFEYQEMAKNIENEELQFQNDFLKKNLIELQIQLRTIADFFIKVNTERVFFRTQLIRFLQNKLSQALLGNEIIKNFTQKFFSGDSEKLQKELNQITNNNNDLKEVLNQLKAKNYFFEEENGQLKKQLKEKRDQLKQFMFTKTGKEDLNNTGNFSTSNRGILLNEQSYISKEYIQKHSFQAKNIIPNTNNMFKINANTRLSNMKSPNARLSDMKIPKKGSLLQSKLKKSVDCHVANKNNEHYNQSTAKSMIHKPPINFKATFGNDRQRSHTISEYVKPFSNLTMNPNNRYQMKSQKSKKFVDKRTIREEDTLNEIENNHGQLFKTLLSSDSTRNKNPSNQSLLSKLKKKKTHSQALGSKHVIQNPFLNNKNQNYFNPNQKVIQSTIP